MKVEDWEDKGSRERSCEQEHQTIQKTHVKLGIYIYRHTYIFMSCTILYIQKNTYQHKCPLDASVLFFFVCSPFEFATLELLKAVASCEELQQCFRMLLKSSSPSPEITVPWE